MNVIKKIRLFIISLMVVTICTSIAIAQDYYNDPFNTADAEAFFLGLSSVCCFVIALPFIIGLLIALWVYKDAEKRGKSGVLWLLVVWFIPFPIGLIIWLIVRPPIGGKQTGTTASSSDRRCPNCGRVIPMDANVCPYCGRDFGN